MLPILAFLGFLSLLFILAARLPSARRRPAPRLVTIDEQGVRRQLPSGELEAVRWDALVRVEICTNSDGPYAEDLFWVLLGADGTGCLVPSSEAGPLLEHVQRLPGADVLAVITALGSTSEAHFLVWSGQPGDGVAAVAMSSPERIDTLGGAR